MPKYCTKKYYCPLCKDEQKTGSNHFGEIYVECKKCGCSVLYCGEIEGLDQLNNRPQKTVTIVHYRIDIDVSLAYHEKYFTLCHNLREKGYTKFDHIQQTFRNPYKKIAELSGEQIILYDPDQFEEQFVSSIGRVHSWAEAIYPNRDIKEGYYLID